MGVRLRGVGSRVLKFLPYRSPVRAKFCTLIYVSRAAASMSLKFTYTGGLELSAVPDDYYLLGWRPERRSARITMHRVKLMISYFQGC